MTPPPGNPDGSAGSDGITTETDRERLRGPHRWDGDPRSPFARDYDRLLFTPAFRRLQGKAQVVTPGEADFFRTRLTHSLEVAQGARRLAGLFNGPAERARTAQGIAPGTELSDEKLLALPADCQKVDPDICEAIAVLHDLGHPPYGHLGETVLAETLAELTGPGKAIERKVSFNANAQSLRLAVTAMSHKPAMPGLQLTRAVLDGAIKYPRLHTEGGGPWSLEPSEREDFEWIRDDVPAPLREQQTLECQIVDLADDVAYVQHDLDDWFRAGYMPLVQLATNLEMQRSFGDWVVHRWTSGERPAPSPTTTPVEIREAVAALFEPEQAFGSFAVAARRSDQIWDSRSPQAREAFRVMRSLLFDDVFDREYVRIVERGGSEGAPRRYRFTLHVDDRVRVRNEILKELLWRYVVSDVRLATQQFGQRRAMRRLVIDHTHAAIADDPAAWTIFPLDHRDRLANASDAEDRLRLAIDFLSSLTDAAAAERFRRLSGAGVGLHSYV